MDTNDRNAAFRLQQRRLFHWLKANIALLHSKRWRAAAQPRNWRVKMPALAAIIRTKVKNAPSQRSG
jgi:hypothetical protein